MKFIGAFFAAWVFMLTPAMAQVVRLDTGLVQGATSDSVIAYKGIPFAAPPVGDLRWRPPLRPAAWQGVRKADTFAPACMQKGVSMPGEVPPATSEDCLYLNLWKPAGQTRGKLAVLVKIYGGGYSTGNAAIPLYWGDRLAARGIIVVTFGYRLGPFGFLAHPDLTNESPVHSSGNYGLLDQVAALQWVQRNIAAFGGDPSRVTIAGQSAGAAAASMLMASPLAKGLFHGVIAQSGGLFEPLQLAPNYLLANAEKEGTAYAASVGANSLAELRGLSAPALLGGRASSISHPVIEPYFLPRSPYEAYAAGRQNDVPVLIGSNANEAGSMITDLEATTAATFESDITRRFGRLPPQLLSAYPRQTDMEARAARLGFERDIRFGWDMWAWARLSASKRPQGTYYYHFTRNPPFPTDSLYRNWGASHFAELWYVFDQLDQERWNWSAADRRLADVMSGYWVNFTKTGNPNGAGLPDWPQFKAADQKVQYLGDDITSGGVPNLRPLQVFDEVYDGLRGTTFGTPSAP